MNQPLAILRPPESGLILLDCDEVLLGWHAAFRDWAVKTKGFVMRGDLPRLYGLVDWLPEENSHMAMDLIREFNDSGDETFGSIGPVDGAQDFIDHIRREGFQCRVITACSLDPAVHRIRARNLEAVFGADAFDDVIYVDLGGSKVEELARQPASWWFDDLPGHVEAANKLGHQGFVVRSSHNLHQIGSAEFGHLRWVDGLQSMIPQLGPIRQEPALTP